MSKKPPQLENKPTKSQHSSVTVDSSAYQEITSEATGLNFLKNVFLHSAMSIALNKLQGPPISTPINLSRYFISHLATITLGTTKQESESKANNKIVYGGISAACLIAIYGVLVGYNCYFDADLSDSEAQLKQKAIALGLSGSLAIAGSQVNKRILDMGLDWLWINAAYYLIPKIHIWTNQKSDIKSIIAHTSLSKHWILSLDSEKTDSIVFVLDEKEKPANELLRLFKRIFAKHLPSYIINVDGNRCEIQLSRPWTIIITAATLLALEKELTLEIDELKAFYMVNSQRLNYLNTIESSWEADFKLEGPIYDVTFSRPFEEKEAKSLAKLTSLNYIYFTEVKANRFFIRPQLFTLEDTNSPLPSVTEQIKARNINDQAYSNQYQTRESVINIINFFFPESKDHILLTEKGNDLFLIFKFSDLAGSAQQTLLLSSMLKVYVQTLPAGFEKTSLTDQVVQFTFPRILTSLPRNIPLIKRIIIKTQILNQAALIFSNLLGQEAGISLLQEVKLDENTTSNIIKIKKDKITRANKKDLEIFFKITEEKEWLLCSMLDKPSLSEEKLSAGKATEFKSNQLATSPLMQDQKHKLNSDGLKIKSSSASPAKQKTTLSANESSAHTTAPNPSIASAAALKIQSRKSTLAELKAQKMEDKIALIYKHLLRKAPQLEIITLPKPSETCLQVNLPCNELFELLKDSDAKLKTSNSGRSILLTFTEVSFRIACLPAIKKDARTTKTTADSLQQSQVSDDSKTDNNQQKNPNTLFESQTATQAQDNLELKSISSTDKITAKTAETKALTKNSTPPLAITPPSHHSPIATLNKEPTPTIAEAETKAETQAKIEPKINSKAEAKAEIALKPDTQAKIELFLKPLQKKFPRLKSPSISTTGAAHLTVALPTKEILNLLKAGSTKQKASGKGNSILFTLKGGIQIRIISVPRSKTFNQDARRSTIVATKPKTPTYTDTSNKDQAQTPSTKSKTEKFKDSAVSSIADNDNGKQPQELSTLTPETKSNTTAPPISASSSINQDTDTLQNQPKNFQSPATNQPATPKQNPRPGHTTIRILKRTTNIKTQELPPSSGHPPNPIIPIPVINAPQGSTTQGQGPPSNQLLIIIPDPTLAADILIPKSSSSIEVSLNQTTDDTQSIEKQASASLSPQSVIATTTQTPIAINKDTPAIQPESPKSIFLTPAESNSTTASEINKTPLPTVTPILSSTNHTTVISSNNSNSILASTHVVIPEPTALPTEAEQESKKPKTQQTITSPTTIEVKLPLKPNQFTPLTIENVHHLIDQIATQLTQLTDFPFDFSSEKNLCFIAYENFVHLSYIWSFVNASDPLYLSGGGLRSPATAFNPVTRIPLTDFHPSDIDAVITPADPETFEPGKYFQQL